MNKKIQIFQFSVEKYTKIYKNFEKTMATWCIYNIATLPPFQVHHVTLPPIQEIYASCLIITRILLFEMKPTIRSLLKSPILPLPSMD